jgi:hypothetical protein
MTKSFSLYCKGRKLLTAIICCLPGLAFAQNPKNFAKDDAGNCACPVIKYINQPAQYYRPLSGLISYHEFQRLNQWKLPYGIKSFDSLFVIKEESSGSGDDFFKELTIASPRDPIKLVHPDGTFTLNLTPCADENHHYVLPLNVTCKPPVTSEMRNVDFSKFENTTLGYVHLYMQLSGQRPDQMIRLAFKEWARNYGPERVNQAITNINEAYNTGIPAVTEKNYADSLMISGVLDSLVSKKLRQERVFTTGFILSEPGIHPPTYDEQYHIEILFQRYFSQGEFELFNPRKFLPDFRVELNHHYAFRQVVMEISSKILSPVKKEAKNPLPYEEIRLAFCDAFFNNESLIRVDCGADACLQPSVITGTTLGIDFDNTILYSAQLQTMYGYDCTPYPQFAKDTSAYKAYPPKKWTLYDTLFTHFTGLVIRDARFTLPDGKTVLLFKGKDVIINNCVVAGCLVADLAADNAGKVLLNMADGKGKTMAIADLLLVLKKAGLNDFMTKIDKKQLLVYFKKVAG